MNRIATVARLLPCALFLFSCGNKNARESEINEKIKQFVAIREDVSIGKVERDKKMDQFAKELTRAYPGAPPFGKDSVERIIKQKSDTVGRFQRVDRITFYQKPKGPQPFDSLIAYTQKEYFFGVANYGVRQGRRWKGNDGLLVFAKDQGYLAEWFGAVMLDQVLKGESRGGIEAMTKGHKFVKTIEYAGQKWAVWYEPGRSRPFHPASRMFITHWNNRFSVATVTTDTTKHSPDYIDQVIDVAWLNQLKYPVK